MVINNGFIIQYGKATCNNKCTVTTPLSKYIFNVQCTTTDTGDYSIIVAAASNYGVGTFSLTTGYNGTGFSQAVYYICLSF